MRVTGDGMVGVVVGGIVTRPSHRTTGAVSPPPLPWVLGWWAMGNGQWATGNGQRAMGNGQRATGDGQRVTGDGVVGVVVVML